jgi:hypothetical protein
MSLTFGPNLDMASTISMHDQVCSGSVSLVEAQHEIATNWISNMFKYQTEEPFMYR